MDKKWIKKNHFCSLLTASILLLSISLSAQWQGFETNDNATSYNIHNNALTTWQGFEANDNATSLYGGKPLIDEQFTVGGRKIKNIQPLYGGKKIDEQSLYNPYLEETFNYIGKPLFSPNPYSHPLMINPYRYNRQTETRKVYNPSVLPKQRDYFPVQKRESISLPRKQQEEKPSLSPIIPTLIGAIDALYQGKKEEDDISGSKRLSLNGWYGDIQFSTGNSGRFSFRNTKGESVSGTYYVSGSRINYNINHYEKGTNNYWRGSSSQLGSSRNVSIHGNYDSISGMSTSYGDTYRYRLTAPLQSYEVEIRDTDKTSQYIRVKGDNIPTQYGYIY